MTEQQLKELIAQHGLSDCASLLLERALPTLSLTAGRAGESQHKSRIGGAPDMPAEVSWPVDDGGDAMTFLLQLNLQELPAFAKNPFPSAGLLSFFVGIDEPATDVEHRIFFWPELAACQRREPPAETVNETFSEVPPRLLNISLGLGLPLWATNEHTALMDEMDEEQQDAYAALGHALQPKNIVGRLLGHASGIGSDPREDAYVMREVNRDYLYNYDERGKLDMQQANHWQHLLTLESAQELDLCIWDAGYLQFLIKDTDLRALDFSHVYAAVESS